MKCLKVILVIFVSVYLSNAVMSIGKEISPVLQKVTDTKAEEAWKKALKKYPLSEHAVELEYRFSFPSEKLIDEQIYLWSPLKISVSNMGYVFVTDQKWRHIFQFDEAGEYKKTFGRRGQGPGEFSNPFCLCATKEHLIVIDNSNLNIQFFDFQGKFVKSKKIFKAYMDMAVDSTGHIYAAPIITTKESRLVDIFNSDGGYINSIIAPLSHISSAWNVANMIRLDVNSADEIFIAFENLPLVCKYSLKGEILGQWKIEQDVMAEREKFNMERFRGKINDYRNMPVINEIQASKNGGFYILSNYPRTLIMEFDKDGRYINEYWAAKSYDYQVIDFAVDEKTNDFYFLQRIPEMKIDVFRPKKTGSN